MYELIRALDLFLIGINPVSFARRAAALSNRGRGLKRSACAQPVPSQEAGTQIRREKRKT